MDGAALGWLLFKGMAVATVPLVYVWKSRDVAKYRKLAWVTAFLTLDLIMFGSFTRLTDSGLGCPDWPGCYGQSNPLAADAQIRAAETAQPSGPVTIGKAWIEMLHRYFALGVGFLIILLTAHAWRRALAPDMSSARQTSPWLATATLLWVCLQGAFGALTVTMKLQPAIVTAHLLGGMVLLALLTALALRESPPAAVDARARELRLLAAVALLAVAVQIALGGWVSSNYAVLACPDFPLCQGQVFPPMDFEHAFSIARPLGMTGDGARITVQGLVAIHWVHRMFALVASALLLWLAWRAWRLEGLARPAHWLVGLLALQILTGVSNVVLQWPLVAAVTHSGGAALLVAVLVTINLRVAAPNR